VDVLHPKQEFTSTSDNNWYAHTHGLIHTIDTNPNPRFRINTKNPNRENAKIIRHPPLFSTGRKFMTYIINSIPNCPANNITIKAQTGSAIRTQGTNQNLARPVEPEQQQPEWSKRTPTETIQSFLDWDCDAVVGGKYVGT
jgi:hypothetical protein